VVEEILLFNMTSEAQFSGVGGLVPPVALNWPSGGGTRGSPREGVFPYIRNF
jgi:hypothetical protein